MTPRVFPHSQDQTAQSGPDQYWSVSRAISRAAPPGNITGFTPGDRQMPAALPGIAGQ